MNFIKLDYSIKEIDDILKNMALITVETTSWIYGEDMGSSENIKMYIEHKKKEMPITYLMYDGEKMFAYLTLSITDSILNIEDIHILKEYRNNSSTMMMILKAITKEYMANKEKVSKVVYYISKINELSQHNFAKYSKSRIEKKNSYMYELDLEHPFILNMINRCRVTSKQLNNDITSLDKYLKNPCRELSIPFWKYKNMNLPNDVKVFHKDDFKNGYNICQKFFRIKHNLKFINKVKSLIMYVDIEKDKLELINMINECYKNENILVSIDDVNNWTSHPTFNSKLWIKIIVDNKIIASGIAEYDKECKEGILEWIQVLPNYRKKGYGKDIVNSLLLSLKELGATFVTVSGNLDNATKPELLYRKCGFEGNDLWYICK